jgi:hypothetical protein
VSNRGIAYPPTLFSIVFNDLVHEIKLDLEVNVAIKCYILLYADDIALSAETSEELQYMLNELQFVQLLESPYRY